MSEDKNWRDIVEEIDPNAHEKLNSYINHVLLEKSDIPRKYKELILIATSAAIRYESSIESHAKNAIEFGATKKEIFEALALASLTSGFTSLISGGKIIEKL